MKVATYRNLAARAGRPGFDIKGRSVIITLTEEELSKARGRFFEGEPEALDSAIQYFLRNRPPARYSIQGQILGLSKQDDTIETKDISSLMTNTWFWSNASAEARQKFLVGVDVESNKLCKYGFLETISRDRYKVTASGRAASRSTLSPFSNKLLLDNLGRIIGSGQESDKFDHLILALVGLPFELEEYDEYLRNVPIPQDLDYVSKVITADPGLRELYQRVEKCPRYATVLRHWIDGTPVDEILRICGLDASIDASLLEGTLPNDANWVLNSLLEMPGAVLKTNAVQRTRIEQVATYCKYGTRDPTAISLLGLGFKHVGRGTAIKLANYFRLTNKSIVDLTLNELNSIFPERGLACTRLSEEIAEKFQKVNN
jgi:replicative superfamily II helicase